MKVNTIALPKISDPRGNLSFLENHAQIPFAIGSVHWIYDVPGGAELGDIAPADREVFIIAMSGSFDLVVTDEKEQNVIQLNRSYNGVYVPKGVKREMQNFSTNSVAVVVVSLEDNAPLADNTDQQVHNIYDCNIIELSKHHSDSRGNISMVDNSDTVPFDVKRIYYLYDVPGGVSRGGHAHRELSQLIIAASGSFTVTLDDGKTRRAFTLNRPYQGLLVKPGIWRTVDDFSSGSCCLVLASEKYEESDYIRNYALFKKYRKDLMAEK